MKILLNIALIALGVFFPFQFIVYMWSNKTKTQAYRIAEHQKNFEIRFYPSATMATISSSASSYKELGRSGFDKLAGYIFGGNDGKQQIAMTAPVHMAINNSMSHMSFVMPEGYNMENLPAPNDTNVQFENTPDQYVATISFGGFASDKDIKRYANKLEALLKANSINYYGDFRFLGYNPPYQLFGRKNEVIVNVMWDYTNDL